MMDMRSETKTDQQLVKSWPWTLHNEHNVHNLHRNCSMPTLASREHLRSCQKGTIFVLRSTMADLADKDAAVSHAINLIRAKVDHRSQRARAWSVWLLLVLVVFEVTLSRFGFSVMFWSCKALQVANRTWQCVDSGGSSPTKQLQTLGRFANCWLCGLESKSKKVTERNFHTRINADGVCFWLSFCLKTSPCFVALRDLIQVPDAESLHRPQKGFKKP